MQGWRDVPIPEALDARPKDERGFPITFVTLIGSDGKPDFTTIDGHKIIRCIREHLCGLCGTRLVAMRWVETQKVAFIGGPLAIENLNFLDPPMHLDCAEYAMQVCPHIVHDTSRYKKQDLSDGLRSEIIGASDDRPDRFGMLVCLADHVGVSNYQGQPVFLVHEALEIHWQEEAR